MSTDRWGWAAVWVMVVDAVLSALALLSHPRWWDALMVGVAFVLVSTAVVVTFKGRRYS